jgi:hypothetical protein
MYLEWVLQVMFPSAQCDRVKKRQRTKKKTAKQNPEMYENKYMKNPTHLKMAM